MRILVIGGAGYLGASLVPELIAKGFEVDVLDALWFGNPLSTSVNIINQDVAECREEFFRGYEQVIYLAGISSTHMAQLYLSETFIGNAALPAYAAYLAKKAKVKRFIFASSCAVYGTSNLKIFSETDNLISKCPYGLSKIQGEQGVMSLADKDFSVIILRQGTISGFSSNMRLDLLLNSMVNSAIKDKLVRVHHPEIWRPVLDIRDAKEAYLRAISSAYKVQGCFNISSYNYLVGKIGELVTNHINNSYNIGVTLKIEFNPQNSSYRVDISKAREVLGFKSKYSAIDIVENLYHRLSEETAMSNCTTKNYDRFILNQEN